MTKAEFMALMRFPADWEALGMYPDELFQLQLAGYQPGHERACEHDRNGAFHWWLSRDPAKAELERLVRLAALDPDPLVGKDVCAHIRRATAYDDEVAALEQRLFQEKM